LAEEPIAALSTAEFRLFQKLVHEEAGIFLGEQKRALLVGRLLPRLRALRLASFRAYHERVAADPSELVEMVDALCTHETCFFREPRQFEFLAQEVLPWWRREAETGRRQRSLRAWSAGCSTGEEPFSLAMTLHSHLPDWRHDVLATDLSTRVLRRASAAVWPLARAEQIPLAYRKAFMLRGHGAAAGEMAAKPELASSVRFARLNLQEASYPAVGKVDLVFCRNVLIYFDSAARQRVVDRLLDRLTPGGLLFLGHAESLNSCARVRSVGPTVYALR
jgi:chemotaxis protein methyltransferase CheR